MANRPRPLLSIRQFKLFVERSLPQESALSKVLLTEKDELNTEVFSSKCEVWLEKRKIGRETRCLPLSIDAVESATCFFMSAALLVGLLAEYLLGLWWADYIATAIILVFVAREGIESYREINDES